MMLIIVSVAIVVGLPLLGYIIYALIKRHRENQLAINLNPRILSELSSAEAVSKFTYGEYLQYKKHLVRDYVAGVITWNGLIFIAFIYFTIKEGINYFVDQSATFLLVFFVVPNILIILGSIIKFAIIGDGEGVLKIKCHVLKESRMHRNHWTLVLFYDRDLCDFRKYRFHSLRRDIGYSDYILARHGYKKMRVICFYDQFMNLRGKFGNME
jgi:hypothetical protein